MTVIVGLSTGCASRVAPPTTPGVVTSNSSFVYQPLSPMTIWVRDAETLQSGETKADITSPQFKDALLRDLDTETQRIALSKVGGSASGTAVAGASVKGESYVLTFDYVKYVTHTKKIDTRYEVADANGVTHTKAFSGNVPLYKGVGVRIRADFNARESGLDISGFPALSVAAKSNRVSGQLTIQTLGITGPQITPLVPIIADFSPDSIQKALDAATAIKAKLYDESTVAYPKIVGFEAPMSQLDAIPALTEFLYGLNEEIVPRVSPDPTKPGRSILWISWKEGTSPTVVEKKDP